MASPFLSPPWEASGDRLLKPGGAIIPAGGCQYLTLVELASSGVPSPWHPKAGARNRSVGGAQPVVFLFFWFLLFCFFFFWGGV